jgi:hypothetical protein
MSNARERSKLKVQEWQINGTIAAIEDVYPQIQKIAFDSFQVNQRRKQYRISTLTTVLN